MKKEELTALGISEEVAKQILAINGKDIENAKNVSTEKRVAELTAERDGFKSQFEAADAALKKFEGIDPEKITGEIENYKKQAEDAKKDFEAQISRRDQRDWLGKKLGEYGVTSPYARDALITECMDEKSGLKWKDGSFFGFDDFMKSAKEKDAGLYQTAEEKAAAAKEQGLKAKAPSFFTGPAANNGDRFKTMTKKEIMDIKDPTERQAAIAANHTLFGINI